MSFRFQIAPACLIAEKEKNLFVLFCFSYLGVSGRQFGRPISGQSEVVGEHTLSSTSQWVAMEGLFIHKNEFDSRTVSHDPSEL